MAYAKGVYIEAIDGPQTVEGVFLVQSRAVGTTRKGDPFVRLRLSDRTGELECRIWANAPAIAVRFNEGDFVRVHARAEDYQGQLQLNIIDLYAVPEAEVSLADYLPATRFSIDALEAQLRALLAVHVRSAEILRFLQATLDEPQIKRCFRLAPAATTNHHNYIGGLLEHVLSMARIAVGLHQHYARYYPGALDGDLLLAGVILHDIGKITELRYDRAFAYTDEGELIGHLVTGAALVQRIASGLPGFPAELALKLQHLVVAHHGRLEYGSPKRPRMIEAVILHEIDVIDARMNAFAALLQSRTQPEPAPAPAPEQALWSEFSRMFEARMLLPPQEGYPWAAPPLFQPDELLGPGLADGEEPVERRTRRVAQQLTFFDV